MILKRIFVLSLMVGLLFVVGCEEKEDDQINKAQKCLDLARVAGDAATCLALIEGIDNEKANRIRCSLVILQNGTTQTEIIDAFQAMDTGTEDPVIEVATILGLGDVDTSGTVDAPDVTLAESIKTTCYKSASIGLKTVAQLILFGTRAQQAADALGDPENPQDVANNITLMNDSDAGQFAIDVYDLYCVPEYSNQDLCPTLNAVGAENGDATTVGAALKACIAANNCT